MAKRSRRARKQTTEKRQKTPVAVKQPPVEKIEKTEAVSPAPVETAPTPVRKVVDFAENYYYVYTDLRNVGLIAVIMFALMFGLGYFI